MKFKRLIALLISIIIVCVLFCSCTATPAFQEGSVKIYFFDVGQADSSLILFPDKTVMLIDSGNRADGPLLSAYIYDLGIDTIDYFVCTHPHEDHVGGAGDIFDTFKVKTVLLPNIDEELLKSSSVHKYLLKGITNEGCEVKRLNALDQIIVGENYKAVALSPTENAIYSDLNDYSLVIKVTAYTNDILFTGDCEKPSELDMINLQTTTNKNLLQADILKVGHHGSKDSTSTEFLNLIKPTAAVISCGAENSYGHPNNEALERLSGVEIYRTDLNGTIIANCFDGGFNIETHKNIVLDKR